MIWDEKEELCVSGCQEKKLFQEGRSDQLCQMLLWGKDEYRELTIIFGKLEVVLSLKRAISAECSNGEHGKKRRGSENVETATIGQFFEDSC